MMSQFSFSARLLVGGEYNLTKVLIGLDVGGCIVGRNWENGAAGAAVLGQSSLISAPIFDTMHSRYVPGFSNDACTARY